MALTLLPKLQQRYRAVSAHETYTAWAATFDALKPKHAAAAEKLRAVYNSSTRSCQSVANCWVGLGLRLPVTPAARLYAVRRYTG
jgi:hypothetical protein